MANALSNRRVMTDDISKYILDLLVLLVYEFKSPRTKSYEARKCMHDHRIHNNND